MRDIILKILQPKYQYIFIPLTFIFGCVIAALHYFIRNNIKKTVEIILIGFIISVIFYLFLPLLVQGIFNGFDILGHKYSAYYFYLVSIPTSIYFIRDQEKYFS